MGSGRGEYGQGGGGADIPNYLVLLRQTSPPLCSTSLARASKSRYDVPVPLVIVSSEHACVVRLMISSDPSLPRHSGVVVDDTISSDIPGRVSTMLLKTADSLFLISHESLLAYIGSEGKLAYIWTSLNLGVPE